MTTTRFAPSPTGYLHIGNLRTALFNYLIARKDGGKFILRLDDTDPERSSTVFADAIKQDLEWLGLSWDRLEAQSSRLDRYADAADRLRKDGRLYDAYESPVELDLKRKKQLNMGRPPVYDRSALGLSDSERVGLRETRDPHWRFKLEHTRITWNDGILGEISIDASSVSDPILIRGDKQVLYTLASVVDDLEMGVTDVVRGSDHVTNTATQIQIINALGGESPNFAHHSLLTGPRGESLSKRLGTLSLRDLRANGIEPMALLSMLARLGSSEPVEAVSSLEQLIEGFTLGLFGSAPTKIDAADLEPLSARILQNMPVGQVAGDLKGLGIPDAQREEFWLMARENIQSRGDLGAWWVLCREGAAPLVDAEDAEFVVSALELLPPRPWNNETWGAWTRAVKQATGRKGRALFMPIRKALTGLDHGPEMSRLLPLLQKIPGHPSANA